MSRSITEFFRSNTASSSTKWKSKRTIRLHENDVEPTDAEFYQEFSKYNEQSVWIYMIFVMTCIVRFTLEIEDSVMEIGSCREESCILNRISINNWTEEEMKSILYPPLRRACMMYDYDLKIFASKSYNESFAMIKKMKTKPALTYCSASIDSGSFSWSSEFIGSCEGLFYRNRINGAKIIGMGFGSLFLGIVSDTWGRKIGLLMSTFAFYLGTFVQPLVHNFTLVVSLSVIKGMGKGGIEMIVVILLLELSSKHNRGILVVYLLVLGPIGTLLGVSMKKELSYVPQLKYIVAIPTLFLLFYVWYMPESPRWYLSYCRKRQAWHILYQLGTRRLHNCFLPDIEYNKFVTLKENLLNLFGTYKFIKTIALGIYTMSFMLTIEFSKKQFLTLSFLSPYSHQALLCMAKAFSFMYVLPPLIILRRRLALCCFFVLIAIQLFLHFWADEVTFYILNVLMMLCIHAVRCIFVLYICEVFPTCMRATAFGLVRSVSSLIYFTHYLHESELFTSTLENCLLFVGATLGAIFVPFLPPVSLCELPDYKRYRNDFKRQSISTEDMEENN